MRQRLGRRFACASDECGPAKCISDRWNGEVKRARKALLPFLVHKSVELVCLDLEAVLVPEIWIPFSGPRVSPSLPELRRTTRDEPDNDKRMRFRIDLMR